MDIDSGLIGGIVPTPGFRLLLADVLEPAESSRVAVLTVQDTGNNMSHVGLVETGENRTPRPAHVRQESTTGVVYG